MSASLTGAIVATTKRAVQDACSRALHTTTMISPIIRHSAASELPNPESHNLLTPAVETTCLIVELIDTGIELDRGLMHFVDAG